MNISSDQFNNILRKNTGPFKKSCNQENNVLNPQKNNNVVKEAIKLSEKSVSTLTKSESFKIKQPKSQNLVTEFISTIRKELTAKDKGITAENILNKINIYIKDPLIKSEFNRIIKKYGSDFPIYISKSNSSKLNTLVYNIITPFKKLFANPQQLKEIKKAENIRKNADKLEWLYDTYKRVSKDRIIKDSSITEAIAKELESSLSKVRTHYSATLSTQVTKISMVISTVFTVFDIINNCRRKNATKEDINREVKARIGQDSIRLGITLGLGYFTGSFFRKSYNNNMHFAIGLAFLNTVASQFLCRMFIKPKSDKINQQNKTPQLPYNPYLQNNTGSRYNNFPQNNTFRTNQAAKPLLAGGVSFGKAPVKKAAKGVFNSLKKAVFSLEGKTKTVSASKFTENMQILAKIDQIRYEKINSIIKDSLKSKYANFNGHNFSKINLDDLINGKITGISEIPIGNSYLYTSVVNFFKTIPRVVKEPFTFILNLVRKAPAKVIKKKQDTTSYILNVMDMLEQAKIKSKLTGKSISEILSKPDTIEKMRSKYGKILWDSSPSVDKVSYDSSEFSNWQKWMGLVSVPFMAKDFYKSTLRTTGSSEEAWHDARIRATQETAEKYISSVFTQGSNTLFKQPYNASLWGVAGVVTGNTTSYNTITRLLLGLPILPKTKEQLDALDNKIAKRIENGGLLSLWYRGIYFVMGKKPPIVKKSQEINKPTFNNSYAFNPQQQAFKQPS